MGRCRSAGANRLPARSRPRVLPDLFSVPRGWHLSQVFPDHSSPGQFPSTRWSRIAAAGDPQASQNQQALAELCTAYWYPLYAYIRRRGYTAEEAQDLTQGFFARILEKGLFAQADPRRGRFRSFLRTVSTHFLANQHDWATAEKRGGGQTFLRIDAGDAEGRYANEPTHELTAEKMFDRSWALTLLERVVARLGREYEQSGRRLIFQELRSVVTEDPDAASYTSIAAKLEMTEGAVRVAAHRLRRRFGLLLRDEIAATVEDPAEVDDEIQALFAALEG